MIMMKFIKIPIFFSFALVVLLTSCEEVIVLDLKDSASRTIIEATLNASTRECVVKATRSTGFYSVLQYENIEGATIELINGAGTSTRLTETGAGIYSAGNVEVSPGEIFQVKLTIAPDEQYLATSKAPSPVYLDSLKIVRGFGDPRPTSPPIYLIKPIWQDPAGIPNYYRFKVTTNGKPQSGSFTITGDEQFDGTVVDLPLYRYSFSLGDTVQLEFMNIDSVSYAYFNQINDMARPSFVSATPYNPIGNFDNGALGYFGIFFAEKKDLIVSVGR